jgi:hypothetical protein
MPDAVTAPCITAAAAAVFAFALPLALAAAPETFRGPGDEIGIKYSSRVFQWRLVRGNIRTMHPHCTSHAPRNDRSNIFFCC